MTMSGFLGKITEDMEEDNHSVDLSALEQLQALKDSQARKIRLNVGGVRHETYKSTLANIPDTRLAWLTQPSAMSNAEYDTVNKEFFFDRHPRIFDAILNYYRTGNLHAPSEVCGPAFEQELQFWGIDEKQIEPCCWSSYTQHRDAQETLAKLTGAEFESDDEDDTNVASYFDIAEDREEAPAKWQILRPKVWTFLEDPYSSKGAAIFAFVSMVTVALSITTFCLETTFSRDDNATAIDTLFYLEGLCVIWFVFELTIRFIFCPNKKKYFINPFHIIDFIGCIPFFVDWIGRNTTSEVTNGGVGEFFGLLRIVRIFRVFKMTRHFSGLQILIQTIRSSAKELMLLSMFLGIGVLTFGSLLYYAERYGEEDPNGCQRIDNIPVGFWWAVVTMTTVGYGDVCPLRPIGKLIGSITGVFGVLMIALPVPVIVNNFALYYSHAQARLKLPKKRKRVLVDVPDALKGHTIQNMSSSISGYSTQSTNDIDCDNTSLHSYRNGNEKGTLKTVSGTIPVTGERTSITVQFMDEISSKSTSPDRTKSIKKPGVGKRSSILPRPSLATNGDARGPRGSNSFKNRRRSFLPAAMTDISSC